MVGELKASTSSSRTNEKRDVAGRVYRTEIDLVASMGRSSKIDRSRTCTVGGWTTAELACDVRVETRSGESPREPC